LINFNKIPFVRVLVPFILGILAGIQFQLEGMSFVLLTLLMISTVFLFLRAKENYIQLGLLITLDLVLFFFAASLTQHAQLNNSETYFGNYLRSDSVTWVAQVNDIPVNKPRSVKFNLKVLKIKDDTGYVAGEGNVIAYFQKNEKLRDLKPGDIVLIRSKLNQIGSPQNPHSFDFKTYLANHSVFHTSYVDSNSFMILPSQAPSSIWQTGLAIKYNIIQRLGKVGLNEDARSICAALITGFDDDIDKEVLESFSHSGTLHILSVSGLHVGLIYLVLNYILSFIDRNKRYRLTQFLFISICLWFFALITGFFAPVLRSVIMFNLLGLGNLYFRNKSFNQINILAVSAFIILIYDPLLIRDIGFLLSYSALFGILYFHPKLYALYTAPSKIIDSVWKSLVVSVSATITTLPVTLLVFHQFPLWFAFANLIIVPLSFVLLLLSFAALFKIGFISALINGLTAFMIDFIRLFNTDGWAFIDRIDFGIADAVFLVLILYLITNIFTKRSYYYAFLVMVTLISWQLLTLVDSYQVKTSNELVVFQIDRSSCISVKNKLNTVLSVHDSDHYSMSVKPNLVTYNNTSLHISPFNFVRTGELGLLILNETNKMPEFIARPLTHVLVSNNSVPNVAFLDKAHPKVLIADGSNSYWALRKLERLCEEYHIQFHSTRDKGAFILPL
jgi:competence protein ComEC